MSNSNPDVGKYCYDLSNHFLIACGHLLLVSKENLSNDHCSLLTKADISRIDSFISYLTNLRERGARRFYSEFFVEPQNDSKDES